MFDAQPQGGYLDIRESRCCKEQIRFVFVLNDQQPLIGLDALEDLLITRRPVNHQLIDDVGCAQSKANDVFVPAQIAVTGSHPLVHFSFTAMHADPRSHAVSLGGGSNQS